MAKADGELEHKRFDLQMTEKLSWGTLRAGICRVNFFAIVFYKIMFASKQFPSTLQRTASFVRKYRPEKLKEGNCK